MTSSPSTSVVMAVARKLNREPTDLPPLQEGIDPDALDALFAARGTGRLRETNGCEVRFRYADLNVCVRGDRDITVEAKDGSDSAQ